jgi:hypothetical protein
MQSVVFNSAVLVERSGGSQAGQWRSSRHLSEAEKMNPLIIEARKSGNTVAIEVFHSHDRQTIFIHFAKEKQ